MARGTQPRKRVTRKEKAEVVRRYQAGEPIGSLRVDKRRAWKTIREWIRDAGVPARPPRTPSPDERQLMAKMYTEDGFSLRTIGKWLGWSSTTVSTCLHEAGVQMRPSKRYRR